MIYPWQDDTLVALVRAWLDDPSGPIEPIVDRCVEKQTMPLYIDSGQTRILLDCGAWDQSTIPRRNRLRDLVFKVETMLWSLGHHDLCIPF